VRKGMAGLRDPRCPIATFVFLGPKGIAKEQLAQALAAVMFGDEAAVIRLSTDRLARARLEECRVAAAVQRRPSTVLVFDEIEKASWTTRELFLQIRDEGQATDALGGLVEFKDTILVAFSGIGGQRIARCMGSVGSQDFESMKGDVFDELQAVFPPEFLRRADFVLVR